MPDRSVVDVCAVAGEPSAGEAQGSGAADALQQNGGAVIPEKIVGVKVVRHQRGIQGVEAQAHGVVRKNGLVGVDPGALRAQEAGLPARDLAVGQMEPGLAGDPNTHALAGAGEGYVATLQDAFG